MSNDTFQSLLARGAEKHEDKDVFVSHSEDVKHTHKELKVNIVNINCQQETEERNKKHGSLRRTLLLIEILGLIE